MGGIAVNKLLRWVNWWNDHGILDKMVQDTISNFDDLLK